MTKHRQLLEVYCQQNGILLDDLCRSLGIKLMNKRTPNSQPRCKYTHQEKSKVFQQLDRAIQAGLPATLTLEQWLITLDYFKWKCAYCQKEPYTTIEHFIPIILDGGTTVQNCVPSCKSCNAIKGHLPPEKVRNLPKEDINRVMKYLSCLV